MKSNAIVISVIGILVIVGAVWFFTGKQTNKTPLAGDEQNPAGTEVPIPASISVILLSQGNSGVIGEAVLAVEKVAEQEQTKVSLNLTGLPIDIVQPAHIHFGSCEALGDVLYPLSDVSGAKSETTIEATLLDIKNKLPLVINVHKSAEAMETSLACGEIRFPEAPVQEIIPEAPAAN